MEKIDLLLLDYKQTNAFVDKVDNQLFTIRNWAITTTGAVFALAITTKQPFVLLTNVFLILGFFMKELSYKCFHEDAIGKSHVLEEIIQKSQGKNELISDYTFGIGHTIKMPTLKNMAEIVWNRWHITVFYLGLVIITIGFWILVGYISPSQGGG